MPLPALSDRRAAQRVALSIAPGVLLAGVGGGMAFPILPLVGLRAGLPLASIGVILAANRFARVLVNPFVGRLVDRIGGKRVLEIGLLLQTVVLGMYLVGVVSGRPGLLFLLGRLLHGPGSACVFVAGQTLALHAGGRDHKGLATGIVRSAMSIGMPLGLVSGGLLAGWIGPAGAFGVAMVAPIIAVTVAFFTVPDLRVEAQKPPKLREVLRSLENRSVAAIAVVNLVSAFAALGVILTTLALILHERGIVIAGLSDETASGVFMGVFVAVMVAVTPVAGRLSDRPGFRAHLVTGGLAVMVPGVLLIGLAKSPLEVAFGLALVGLGSGGMTSPLLALLGDLVPATMRGSAVGSLQLFGDLGGTLGPIVGTSLLAGNSSSAYYLSAGLLLLVLPLGQLLARAERAAGR